jgi:hypothetical protein
MPPTPRLSWASDAAREDIRPPALDRYFSSSSSLVAPDSPQAEPTTNDDDDDDQPLITDAAGYMNVGVRLRPLDASRGTCGDGLQVNMEKKSITYKDQKYRFAHIFDDEEDNDRIFDTVGKSIVASSLSGYNGTLFAYGQTGSGKTYTMGESAQIGTEHEGVGHRMIRCLYQRMARDKMHAYQVEVSFLQVYIERIHDMLAEKRTATGKPEELTLREDKQEGVYVVGARKQIARCAADCCGARVLACLCTSSACALAACGGFVAGRLKMR